MSVQYATRLTLIVLLSCSLCVLPVEAGSNIVGSLIGGSNALLGQRALRAGGTILSGDKLRVNDGSALVGIEDGSRMTFGERTSASFQKESSRVTATLDQGTMSLFHTGDDRSPLRVQIADVYVIPGSGFETIGEIAMTGETLIVVTREGLLRVEGGGRSVEVGKGRMITLHSYPAGAPQIRTVTARPAFIRDLKYAVVAVAGAVGLAVLINHIIETNSKTPCEILNSFNPATPILPPQCR